MKFHKFLIAGAAAAACAGAWAEDVTVSNIDLTNGTAIFGTTHLVPGAFTDIFNFINGPALANASASLATIAIVPGDKDITFTSATLNGTPFTLSAASGGQFEFGSVSAMNLSGPFSITVMGTATGVGPGDAASYSGTLSVVAVPEPGTYAMLLAGLGAIGFVAARRKRNS